jgi:phytoene/squalene synthetase
VAEDYGHGRVYLPQEDLDRFGVVPADLADPAREPVRRLVLFEAERAMALLAAGAPLVRRLSGWPRLAVSGYIAGGRAAVRSLRRGRATVRKRDVVRELARLYVGRPT